MEFEVKKFVENHSLPFYLFDEQLFLDNINRFESTFQSVYPNYHIAYSFKTNYTPYICNLVKVFQSEPETHEAGTCFQVASFGSPDW